MIDRIKMFLNCNQELQEKIKIFIEYFVKYYGEDRREEIEKKLSKAIYIGYITPEQRKTLIRKLLDEESAILQEEIVKKSQLELSNKDLFDNTSFVYDSLMPLSKLVELKKLHDKGKRKRLKEFNEDGYEFIKRFYKDMSRIKYLTLKSLDQLPFRTNAIIEDNIEFFLDKNNAEKQYHRYYKESLKLLKKIDPNITFDKLGEVLNDERVLHLIAMYEEAIKQFELFKKENERFITASERNEKLESTLKEKYFLMYLKENIDLIPEEERKPIYDYLSGKTRNLFINKYIGMVLGYSLSSISYLEYFNKKNDDVLEKGENSWKIKSIKQNRIEYFKIIGIDLGDNYEDYVNNSECQNRWPSKETIERIIASKDNYYNKFNNEYFNSIEEYKTIREKIDSLDLLDKNDSFNAKLLTDSGTFVSPNVVLNENGYDTHSLFVINFGNLSSDTKDHYIVHELNHLLELTLSSIDDKNYEMVVGWDFCSGSLDEERSEEVDTINTKDPKRQYELFNEIINELIAQEISKMMVEDHVAVFDVPGESRYKGRTSYEDYLAIVYKFYHENKDAIIESRREGNMQIIYDHVGEENFKELNALIQYFYQVYSEDLLTVKLKTSLMNKQENELTKTYYEILAKRDEILDNIRIYKEEHNITK